MGFVYKAEQDQPRRLVALKALKTGLAGPESFWPFERESLVLDRLQHPGIARIYEAGTAETDTGFQPSFAMGFIHGHSIGEDAELRQLNTRQQLETMAMVADALQHAHRRGIIHRDLKPSQRYLKFDPAGRPSDDLVVWTRTREGDRWRLSQGCLAACFSLYTTVLTGW